ncbi:outer membrane protein [Dyella sp.]|uniref:outer membrane protein n=1 Tax=Dyella sp. TaxID=1869338 RepID=UPI002ED18A63
MRKNFFVATLAAAALLPLIAHAAPLDNFFVAGNLGQTKLRSAGVDHNKSVFQNARFGWRWNGIVGPEMGYAYLGRPKTSFDGGTISARTQAATLGVNARWDFTPSWFVTGHSGYARTRTTTQFNDVPSRSQSLRSTNNGWYAGVGVGYNMTQHVSLGLNYDNYGVSMGRRSQGSATNTNIAAYSASLEYRF